MEDGHVFALDLPGALAGPLDLDPDWRMLRVEKQPVGHAWVVDALRATVAGVVDPNVVPVAPPSPVNSPAQELAGDLVFGGEVGSGRLGGSRLRRRLRRRLRERIHISLARPTAAKENRSKSTAASKAKAQTSAVLIALVVRM
jgi:hypothetical protein